MRIGMNYELAKKLKEAGFPQPEGLSCEHIQADWDKGMPWDGFSSWKHLKTCTEVAYYPTLSELIEECGEGFFGLNRLETNEWSCHFMEDENPDGEPVYKTPEEAVANLWLSLNSVLYK